MLPLPAREQASPAKHGQHVHDCNSTCTRRLRTFAAKVVDGSVQQHERDEAESTGERLDVNLEVFAFVAAVRARRGREVVAVQRVGVVVGLGGEAVVESVDSRDDARLVQRGQHPARPFHNRTLHFHLALGRVGLVFPPLQKILRRQFDGVARHSAFARRRHPFDLVGDGRHRLNLEASFRRAVLGLKIFLVRGAVLDAESTCAEAK